MCWTAIVRITPPWCETCGLPFLTFAAPPAPGGVPERCAACVAIPPPWDYARAAAQYVDPLRLALGAFKFQGRRALARPLAGLLVEQCGPALPADVEVLVPVPLGRARERERGFNQSLLLARALGRRWGCPVWDACVLRARATRTQTRLTPEDRLRNVRGAFRAVGIRSLPLRGAHLVLVDDVVTTAATLNACATALFAGGARILSYVTFGRAPATGDRA
jgi:ComF family protein